MLTREYIMNLEAGREMDILVNQTLFGYNVRSHGATEKIDRVDFNPSTFLPNAWEVVDKTGKEVTVKKYEAMAGWRYWCRVSNTDPTKFDEVVAHGKTAPEAICKAALLTTIQE